MAEWYADRVKFERPPLDEGIETTPKEEVAPSSAFEAVDHYRSELVANVGEREVEEAVAQVVSGKAEPEALLAWIDDVRSLRPRPPGADVAADDEPALGFLHDFDADTEMAYEDTIGGPEAPEADDAPQVATAPAFFDTDPDYFFSATRRKAALGEDDDADPDHGGGGGGGDDGKPRDGKAGGKGTPRAAAPPPRATTRRRS